MLKNPDDLELLNLFDCWVRKQKNANCKKTQKWVKLRSYYFVT